MKIIALEATNFKRIKAVSIKPDGTMQQITGRNAQGKSSILDALYAALGGKDASPSRPIRDGQEKASVSVTLGDIKVTRKWKADGKTELTVESKDGATYKSPQAMLDKLTGQLAFDPLAFVREPGRQQAATLRKLVGIDTGKLDAERAYIYEQRTVVNRDVKNLQGQLAGMPEIEHPGEVPSLPVLLDEHRAAQRQVDANKQIRAAYQQKTAEGERLVKAIEEQEQRLASLRAQQKQHEADQVDRAEVVAELVDPDLTPIEKRMGEVETIAERARQHRARQEKVAELKRRADEADGLTAKIDKLDEEKAALLAATKFPIDGLAVDGDVVTFQKVPLAQASSAEQIRVSLAVAAALNPTLRVVLVRDGSLLDADGMRLVAEWAAANDMQVLMERVADGARVGIVIEDGMVSEDDAATVAA